MKKGAVSLEVMNAIGLIGEEDLSELRHAIERYTYCLRAPDVRVKKVVDEAACIERLAARLAKELDSFYQTIGLIVETGRDTPEIYRFYFTYDDEPRCLEICKALGGLSSMISRVRKEVALTFGSGDLKRPDSGGRGGIHSRVFGSAKRRFVRELAEIWDRYRGYPTGSVPGPFYNFVCTAHDCATGSRSYAGLDNEFKIVAPEYRRRVEIWSKVFERIYDLQLFAENFPNSRDGHYARRRACRLMDWQKSDFFPARRPCLTTLMSVRAGPESHDCNYVI